MENTENINNVAEVSAEETKSEKTYSEAEVTKLLQSEADKRVQQALKTQAAKYEKRLAQEKSLSALDEESRVKAEKDIEIEELRAKVKEYAIIENKNEIMKTLSARSLPTQFADFIEIGDDITEAQAKIEAFDKLFKRTVDAEVKKRLGETAGSPIASNIASGTVTKEQFMKMGLAERSQLYNHDPELYNELSRR